MPVLVPVALREMRVLARISADKKKARTRLKPLSRAALAHPCGVYYKRAESARFTLENRYTLTGIVGSNPTASANFSEYLTIRFLAEPRQGVWASVASRTSASTARFK